MIGWLAGVKDRVAFFEGGNVESTVGFQTRCEVLLQMVPRYLQTPVSQKGALLDEIVDTIPSCRWCLESTNVPRIRSNPLLTGLSLSDEKQELV
jgi:hypothetical protein